MALIWNWEFQSMSSRFGFRNVSTSFDNEMLWLANETLNQNEQRIFRFSIWQKGRRLLRVTLIYKIRRGEHLNNSKHWQIVVEILNILIRLDFNTPKWIHLQKDTIRDPNWWDWEPFKFKSLMRLLFEEQFEWRFLNRRALDGLKSIDCGSLADSWFIIPIATA